MKLFITIGLLVVYLHSAAQWSNTSNEFYDSLQTPVSLVAGEEQNPLVLQSYPDSGYFVIWLDKRDAATKTNIYTQKYDKNGSTLWGTNGKPVTTAAGNQTYISNSNQDYRSRSFVATDSAGGFYICYSDDAAYYPRIVVQHMKSDGSPVFSGPGFVADSTTAANGYFFQSPLLIPDGKKGFFLSYVLNNGFSLSSIIVADYRDDNGVMNNFGRYVVNRNATQRQRFATCTTQLYVELNEAGVTDYNIWPDGQGGCNIIMSLNVNTESGNKNILGFNRLWRAKKDAIVTRAGFNEYGFACKKSIRYSAGNVYMMYARSIENSITYCDPGPPSFALVNQYKVRTNGYKIIDIGAYDYNYPKGVTIPTSGNININMIAVTQRQSTNTGVSNPTVQGYAFKVEKYDSIPYEVTTVLNPYTVGIDGLKTEEPPLSIFKSFEDTLLASNTYTAYPDFSFAAGGDKIFASALLNNTSNSVTARQVILQSVTLQKDPSLDSFYLSYKAPKAGLAIGSELYTGGPGGIAYEFPRLNVTPSGSALFSIYDGGRSTRVSPISGTRLTWGAMGRPIGTGINRNSYYANDNPVVALDAGNASGIVAWRDSRAVSTAPNTDVNIFIRHLDKLNADNFTPPVRPVRLIPNPFTGISEANSVILYGTSNATTPIEFSSIYFDPSTTTLATIEDDYNIGRLQSFIYQNSAAVRRYNNTPYLDRNFTFVPQNFSANMAPYMTLYFTKAEFAALQAADPTVKSIYDLSIINQPLVPNTVPAAYAPVSDEIAINPRADSIESGYRLQFRTSRLGNFFIMKLPSLTLCPGGSAALNSGITGSIYYTYKWAVNTDGGDFYTPINDNSNYSGTNTATLQLNNIPSSFYGYKYVCIVSGSLSSRVFALQFVNNWKGTINGNWNDPANWSCGAIPDANTDVTIKAGSANVNTNGFCRTLTVSPGAAVTVNPGYALTVTK